MIDTIGELRQFLSGPPEDAREAVAALEAVFSSWPEGTLGALLLDTGMILGTRRGEEGVEALALALEGLAQLLMRRDRLRRMN